VRCNIRAIRCRRVAGAAVCPNVINIFRARGVEKDSLPRLSLPPPAPTPHRRHHHHHHRHHVPSSPAARIIPGPAPIFLLMHPPLRGRPQIFNLHFSSTHSSRRLPPPHLPPPSLSFPWRPTAEFSATISRRKCKCDGEKGTRKRRTFEGYVSRLLESFSSLAETPISSHLHGQT